MLRLEARVDRSEISIIVCTYNEERNLPGLLASVGSEYPIHVVDSGSSDSTIEIAREAGCHVLSHPYGSHARQRNWAFDNAGNSPWVFVLDADERPDFDIRTLDALRERAIAGGKLGVAFPRKNYFLGKWMRNGGWWPDLQVRLCRRDDFHYEDHGPHSHVTIAPGDLLLSDLPLLHLSFATVDDYWRKFISYTREEAMLEWRIDVDSFRPRAARLKVIYHLLPGRALVKFIYMYILRRGFLDGRRGFLLALWSATYETVIRARRLYDGGEDAEVERGDT